MRNVPETILTIFYFSRISISLIVYSRTIINDSKKNVPKIVDIYFEYEKLSNFLSVQNIVQAQIYIYI